MWSTLVGGGSVISDTHVTEYMVIRAVVTTRLRIAYHDNSTQTPRLPHHAMYALGTCSLLAGRQTVRDHDVVGVF